MDEILPIILGLFAVVLLMLGILLLQSYLRYAHQGKLGVARLVQILPPTRDRAARAVVEMMMPDGSHRQCTAQAARLRSFVHRVGQEVPVAYTERKVFGKSALNVYMLQGAHERPYRLRLYVGVLLLVLAVVAVVAILGIVG